MEWKPRECITKSKGLFINPSTFCHQFSVKNSHRGGAATEGEIGIAHECASNAPEWWMFGHLTFNSPSAIPRTSEPHNIKG